MENMNLLNMSMREDVDHIVWLTLDKEGSSTNTLNIAILEELLQCIRSLAVRLPKALVIQSGKTNGFIAGADIHQFQGLETVEFSTRLIMLGQQVFKELAALPFVTVAWISGFCLGGGLELVLACRYRIAEDHLKTKLGLPEVMLGIHPGWGGTVRLPRLIGTLSAMELILTGRSVSAKKAFSSGMVDACVPKRHALTAVLYYANLKNPVTKPVLHRLKKWLKKTVDIPFVRPLVGKFLYKTLNKKINIAHYPAPYAAVDNWVEQGIEKEEALQVEAHSIIQLTTSETARNLVRVFHLQERLKGLGRDVSFVPIYVHVVGAGTMGGDIAAWCALKGFHVTLQDVNVKAIAVALKRAESMFEKHLKESHLIQAAKDRLVIVVHQEEISRSIAKSDVIIEAIVEKPEAKQALFKMLESLAKPEALLASNTSTILLKNIACALQDPTRLVGIHFFNPVFRMNLIEVISSVDTDPICIQRAMAFVRAIDKLPLPVKSSPGFLVNRVLMPYLVEAMCLLEEGVSKETIDKAAVNFGMPMGPLELIDAIGLDVCLLAGESLKLHLGAEVPQHIQQMVKKGHLGKKSGIGFYEYKQGKPIKKPENIQESEVSANIVDRLIGKMTAEAMICLKEGVVSDVDLIDVGMIFGAGFPPFRGGLMHYQQHEKKSQN